MKTRLQIPTLHLIAGTSSALAVTLVFLPVVFGNYGIYDSLRMTLDFAWTGESRLMGVMLGGGRFAYAWLAKLGFSSIETIEGLWILRALGVLSLVACSFIMTVHACRRGWGFLAAVCAAVIAFVNPGAAVYGFWSACFPYGLGILASFFAGILWERSNWRYRIVSILLMQIALTIYQPAALYFFLGPFITWFGKRDEPVRPFVVVWCVLGILLNLMMHVVLVRIVMAIFPELPNQSSRLVEGGMLPALQNLVTSVIPRVFAGWGDLFSGKYSLGMILIFAAGWFLFLAKSRGRGDRLARILTLVPISLTLLPAFVSVDGYAPCRLLAPAYCGIGMVALAGFAQGFRGWFPLRSITVVGLGLSLLVAASFSVQFGVVKPRVREHSVIRQALKESSPDEPLYGMSIIRPKGTYPIDQHILQKAEYGAYELTYGGFSEAYLSLIAAEVYDWTPSGLNPINQIHWIFCEDSVEAVPPFYPVLDLRERLQGIEVTPLAVSQGTTVRHPYLGDALFFPPSLYLTPVLGLTQQEADLWFFKPGHGWMQWIGEPGTLPLKAKDTEGNEQTFERP